MLFRSVTDQTGVIPNYLQEYSMQVPQGFPVQVAQQGEWFAKSAANAATLGQKVSRSTVRRILKEQGIDPAPERSRRMPWSTFLKAHWEAIAAADFFTVEVMSGVGLIRYVVFFVIDLPTRKVEIAGIAPIPDGLWMEQVARNLIEGVAEPNSGRVTRRERLDGILSHSYRDAA